MQCKQGGNVFVCMRSCECVILYHLADAVHRAGSHWQVSNRSGLRGATLQVRGEKVLCASSFTSDPVITVLKCIKSKMHFITL